MKSDLLRQFQTADFSDRTKLFLPPKTLYSASFNLTRLETTQLAVMGYDLASTCRFFSFFLLLFSGSLPHCSAADRDILTRLYEDFDGENQWTRAANWSTAVDLDDWEGVTTDPLNPETVIRLDLLGNFFSGTIPTYLCELSSLQSFAIYLGTDPTGVFTVPLAFFHSLFCLPFFFFLEQHLT